MANKIDKEFLIKNRFWIALGTVGFLVFICWLVLLVGSSAADERKARYVKAQKDIDSKSKTIPKNENFAKPWKDYGEVFNKQKEGVWGGAWKKQENLYTWPSSNDAPFGQKMRYYDDEPMPDLARAEYARHLYEDQFKGLAGLVTPVEFNGGQAGFEHMIGPTIGGGGGSSGSAGRPGAGAPGMPGMPGSGGGERGSGSVAAGGAGDSRSYVGFFPKEARPTMEEIWLVQEDFWVKREMLNIIREALNKSAHFDMVPIPDTEPKPDKILSRHRFKSANWEITLLIDETMEKGKRSINISPHSTIKNINASKRTLLVANSRTGKGLAFKLEQAGEPREFTVEGTPLPYDQSIEFKKWIPMNSVDFNKEFALEQKLEWATSPIRRIDELRTAKNSHRLAFQPLKPNAAFKDEKKDDATGGGGPGAPPGGGSPPGTAPNIAGLGAGMNGGSTTGPNSAGSSSSATPNGLERNRYVLTNEQCRHLPIAMVLIVDQAAVNDVLIAAANSPLRIQVTQTHLLHVRDPGPTDVVPEETPGGGSSGSDRPGSGSRPGGPPLPGGFGGAGVGGAGVGGRPGGPNVPGMPSPGGTGSSSAATETAVEDNNLFELTLYGVATLYERFPKKGEQPKDAGQPK